MDSSAAAGPSLSFSSVSLPHCRRPPRPPCPCEFLNRTRPPLIRTSPSVKPFDQSMSTGDSNNACLTAANNNTCWSSLDQYTTKIPTPETGTEPELQDYIDTDGQNAEGVCMQVASTDGSNLQTITIKTDIANIIGSQSSGGSAGSTYSGSSRTVTIGDESFKSNIGILALECFSGQGTAPFKKQSSLTTFNS